MKTPSSNDSNSAPWPDARRGMAQILAATLGFALWHSLLCALPIKARISPFLAARGIAYRTFFNAQSLFCVGALIGFLLSRPHRTLYRIRGAWKLAFWLVQGASLAWCAWAFWSARPLRFLVGSGEVEPEAQGPNLVREGTIEARGAYLLSRHPLEWGPLALLFFTPHLKTNWLAFNVLSAVYMVLGALHEEKRLEKRGGKSYRRYQKRVSFWFGKPRK